MIKIDALISMVKSFYTIKESIRFDLPVYEQFHNDLLHFIYENHFENTPEWELISKNLVYKSSQYMNRTEGDTILIQLDSLKRKLLARENEGFWSYVHPQIYQVSKDKFYENFYADAVESAFKEINARIKRIYLKSRGEEKDGQDLMRQAFSPKNPVLTFESLESESGRNVQEGYMQMFAGAMQGIRNPHAHANMTISREETIKQLIFASLLMAKIDTAVQFSNLTE